KLLDERGYVHQVTDAAALDSLASEQVVSAYVGYDATAPSLHVGNLVSIMMLRRLQQAGHKPIVLMGGGTTKVGDPSGKDESRKLLTAEAIDANIAAIRKNFEGSDQWGNIVNGIELGRRIDGTELYGVTTPLITTADGAKMGKTAQGAVWLSADLLSPYDYWQFWRNTQDSDVGHFLRIFTDL